MHPSNKGRRIVASDNEREMNQANFIDKVVLEHEIVEGWAPLDHKAADSPLLEAFHEVCEIHLLISRGDDFCNITELIHFFPGGVVGHRDDPPAPSFVKNIRVWRGAGG